MIHIEAKTVVARPVKEVFDFIANPENNPQWQGGMVAANVTSEGPLGVGSIYEQEAQFLGRKIVSTFEIVRYEVGHLITGKSIAGSFPISFTRIVESHPEGALAKTIVEGDASGFFRITTPLMKLMVGRSIRADYINLKRVLESE